REVLRRARAAASGRESRHVRDRAVPRVRSKRKDARARLAPLCHIRRKRPRGIAARAGQHRAKHLPQIGVAAGAPLALLHHGGSAGGELDSQTSYGPWTAKFRLERLDGTTSTGSASSIRKSFRRPRCWTSTHILSAPSRSTTRFIACRLKPL